MPTVLFPPPFLYPIPDIIDNILGLKHASDFIQGTIPDPPHAKQLVDAVGNHLEIQGNPVPFQTVQNPGG